MSYVYENQKTAYTLYTIQVPETRYSWGEPRIPFCWNRYVLFRHLFSISRQGTGTSSPPSDGVTVNAFISVNFRPSDPMSVGVLVGFPPKTRGHVDIHLTGPSPQGTPLESQTHGRCRQRPPPPWRIRDALIGWLPTAPRDG